MFIKKRILISGICSVVALGGIFIHFVFFSPNTRKAHGRLELKEKTSCGSLLKELKKKRIINNTLSFKIAASFFRKRLAKQGSYKINENISNFELLNKLTRGEQDPIKITIGPFDTLEELAKYLDQRLLFSKKEFLDFCHDENLLKEYNVNENTVLTLFLSNTYQFYWNVPVEKFFDKMFSEFNTFWTKERLDKAKNMKFTPNEIIILASIVEKEIVRKEEASRVAGVFINRLKSKMRLQSCPTTFYARKYDPKDGDNDKIMRCAKSRYNTYRYGGLPIGPICIPSLQTIDAVLNYEKHDFLFFVTAPDRTHHLFAQTFDNHRKNIRYTFRLNQKSR